MAQLVANRKAGPGNTNALLHCDYRPLAIPDDPSLTAVQGPVADLSARAVRDGFEIDVLRTIDPQT